MIDAQASNPNDWDAGFTATSVELLAKSSDIAVKVHSNESWFYFSDLHLYSTCLNRAMIPKSQTRAYDACPALWKGSRF
jgi:hypothetical protein